MENEMKIRALAPWFGAKRTLASAIIGEFGPHNRYWEPMCGSCAVLLAKEPVAAETVNDLHGDLANLARCLSRERFAREIYGLCSRILCHESLWREAAAAIKEGPPPQEGYHLKRAYQWLMASWMARNGYGGTDSAFNSFARGSQRPAVLPPVAGGPWWIRFRPGTSGSAT